MLAPCADRKSEISRKPYNIARQITPAIASQQALACNKTSAALHRPLPEIPPAMIAFGSPYSLYDAPRVPACINPFATMETMQKAALDCLMGRARWNLPPARPLLWSGRCAVLKRFAVNLDKIEGKPRHLIGWKCRA